MERRAQGQKQSCGSTAPLDPCADEVLGSPHSDTQKALSLGSSQPWRSLCGVTTTRFAWEKMSPFPSHRNGTCSPAHSAQNTRCFLSKHQGPKLGPSCISPLFTTASNTCPPVTDRAPGSAPHCEVQASSHLGPHEHLPQGDCGSIRGTVCCLCCWVSSPALQPHPDLSCRDQGHGLLPGAQSVPTDSLILTRTVFEEDFCIGVGHPSGNRAGKEKK